jgi:hypothetical protein
MAAPPYTKRSDVYGMLTTIGKSAAGAVRGAGKGAGRMITDFSEMDRLAKDKSNIMKLFNKAKVDEEIPRDAVLPPRAQNDFNEFARVLAGYRIQKERINQAKATGERALGATGYKLPAPIFGIGPEEAEARMKNTVDKIMKSATTETERKTGQQAAELAAETFGKGDFKTEEEYMQTLAGQPGGPGAIQRKAQAPFTEALRFQQKEKRLSIGQIYRNKLDTYKEETARKREVRQTVSDYLKWEKAQEEAEWNLKMVMENTTVKSEDYKKAVDKYNDAKAKKAQLERLINDGFKDLDKAKMIEPAPTAPPKPTTQGAMF